VPTSEASQGDKARSNKTGGWFSKESAFLGIVGLIFTAAQVGLAFLKDDFDRRSKKFDVIVEIFQKCASNAPADQAFATRFLGVQAKSSLASYDSYFAKDKEFNLALQQCESLLSNDAATQSPDAQQGAVASTQPSSPLIVSPPEDLPASAASGASSGQSNTTGPDTPSAPPNDGPRFWVYLGTYTNGAWATRYLDVPSSFDPNKFSPEEDPRKGNYKVRAGQPLNLRYGSFSPVGEFPPLIKKPLQPGQAVKVRSMVQWFISGNWWATIAPPGPE
jgi:hypothetical protein